MQGDFSLAGHFPEVRDNVELVQGLFSDSLPPFLRQHYKNREHHDITFLHIDCDLYQGQCIHFFQSAVIMYGLFMPHCHLAWYIFTQMTCLAKHQLLGICTLLVWVSKRDLPEKPPLLPNPAFMQLTYGAGAIEALMLLDRYIAPGCVLLFDDLINYPEYREHEIKALWEWLQATDRKIEVPAHLAVWLWRNSH